jgi:hypothetical protein
MARHALREADTPNADPAKRQENTVLGPKTVAEVMAAIEAKLPTKRRRDAVPVVEFLIGASPEVMREMSRSKQESYFQSALSWLGQRFGGTSNLVSAVIHRDETTPHMQVLLVPLLNGRLNAKALVGNKQTMKDMQSDFARQVGEPHGLRRGEEGSRAKHTTIAQFYGALRAVGRNDALPPRIAMPHPLPKPGMFAGEAERAAFAKREAEREDARQANAKRQEEIERLAQVGVAVHGRGRRRLVDALGRAKEAQAQAVQAGQVVDRARKRLDQLGEQKYELEREVGLLLKRRDTLSRQVTDLEAPKRRPRPDER